MQERETKEGKRTTIQEFAKFLEVSQPLLSTWLKGNTEPSDKKIQLLAEKLGEEVYETLGKIRPDPFIRYITKNWKKLPEKKQKEILETIKKYTNDPIPEENNG